MENNKEDANVLTPLQTIVFEVVREIIDMKQGEVEPCVAHVNEIRNSINIELMEALRGLCRMGIFSVSVDVNKNPMFQLKQKK